MRVFALRIESPLGIAIEGLQGRDAGELDGAAMFSRVCQKLGGRQDCRRATLSCRDGLDEVRYRLAQGRQLGAIGQHDRLSKTQGPGHAATPQQNRDSSRGRMVGSGRSPLPAKKRPQLRGGWSRLTWGLCRGAARHSSDCEPASRWAPLNCGLERPVLPFLILATQYFYVVCQAPDRHVRAGIV